MSDIDAIADMQGSNVRFRVDALTIPALLVRMTRSKEEIGLEVVFDGAQPAEIKKFYEYTRRRIHKYVTVNISGASFSSKLLDTTRLPTGYKPEGIANMVFEFVFSGRARTGASGPYTKGMIALPVPRHVVKSWQCRHIIPNPHITLAFMPKITDAQATEVAAVVRDVATGFKPIEVITHGQGVFGTNSRVALVATNPELRAFRHLMVARVLRKLPKIIDVYRHPMWQPHVTLGDHSRVITGSTDSAFTIDAVDVDLLNGSVYSTNFAM